MTDPIQITEEEFLIAVERNMAMDENMKKLCQLFREQTGMVPPPLFSLARYDFETQCKVSAEWKKFYQGAFERAWELFFSSFST